MIKDMKKPNDFAAALTRYENEKEAEITYLAEKYVNCLAMGISITEAQTLNDEMYSAICKAWAVAHSDEE